MIGRRRAGLAPATLTLLGCNAVLGVEELDQGPEEGPSEPSSAYAAARCESCTTDRCSSALTVCAEDDACAALHACVATCRRSDWECRARCESADTEAASREAWASLDACLRSQCLSDCYGTSGLVDGIGPDTCPACFDISCQDDVVSCMRSEPSAPGGRMGDCERQWWCIREGDQPDPARRLACAGGYADPADPRTAFHFCRDFRCPQLCTFGRTWECLRDFSWPPPIAPTTSYDVYVRSATNEVEATDTVPSVRVRACAPDDCASCTAPLSEGTTAEGGTPASLELPTEGRGFEGCMHVEQQPSPLALHPTIHYIGRPIVAHEVRLTLGIQPYLPSIQSLLRLELAPDRGHVYITLHDCYGDRAKGARFEVSGTDTESVAFFTQGTFFPEFVAPPTNVDGTGGFLNVPPGTHEVRALVEGTVVASMTVEVRPEWVTQIWLYPMSKDP